MHLVWKQKKQRLIYKERFSVLSACSVLSVYWCFNTQALAKANLGGWFVGGWEAHFQLGFKKLCCHQLFSHRSGTCELANPRASSSSQHSPRLPHSTEVVGSICLSVAASAALAPRDSFCFCQEETEKTGILKQKWLISTLLCLVSLHPPSDTNYK